MNTQEKKDELAKLEKEHREESIRMFVEMLNKHLVSSSDIWSMLDAISKVMFWIADERFTHDENVIGKIKYIKNTIQDHGYKDLVGNFEKMAESAVSAMILSNQCSYGIDIVLKMREDIEEILNRG